MIQANMRTFSNISNVPLLKSEQKCEKHGCNLLYFEIAPEQAACYECRKETVEQQDKDRADKASREYYIQTTYAWLDKHSIYLDNTLRQATFYSYKPTDEETARNKQAAMSIASQYHQGETYNTIFTGKAGTGKSHLSKAILEFVNEHSDPYRKCLFVSVDELMRRIKDSISNKQSYYAEQRMVSLLTEADLLVLDDLGAETGSVSTDKSATDYTTRTLYAIINGRMSKPTIITTNLNSKDMVKMYDSKLISRMFRGAEGHVIKFQETNDKRRMLEF